MYYGTLDVEDSDAVHYEAAVPPASTSEASKQGNVAEKTNIYEELHQTLSRSSSQVSIRHNNEDQSIFGSFVEPL